MQFFKVFSSFLFFPRAEIAVADPSAVLIFSGGVTRPSSPSQSEAQSYLRLALDSGLLMNRTHIAFAEDYALDSFQNLLFSVARFHEVVSGPYRWPEKITVVGFEMKRRRFEELHRKAIRWPKSKFQYVGVDVVGEAARAEGWRGEVSSHSGRIISCSEAFSRRRTVTYLIWRTSTGAMGPS